MTRHSTQAGESVRQVTVQRGIFVLRYASAADIALPPVFEVTVDTASLIHIELTASPGKPRQALREPGDYLIVRAQQPGLLYIKAQPSHSNGSIAGELKLEPIEYHLSGKSAPSEGRSATPKVGGKRLPQPRIMAHISRRGDVSGRPDEWLAGPRALSPVEGLRIDWSEAPEGVSLGYSVIVGQSDPKRTEDCALGQFAGTRGRHLPVVGLRAWLTGPNAYRYLLKVEAIFQNMPPSMDEGLEVSASGPTGREALLDLRLSVVPAEFRVDPSKSLPASGDVRFSRQPPSPTEPGNERVRVFRRDQAGTSR